MIKVNLKNNIHWQVVLNNSLIWGEIILTKKYKITSNWLGILEFVKLHNLTYVDISKDQKQIILSCIHFESLTENGLKGFTTDYKIQMNRKPDGDIIILTKINNPQ